MGDHVRVCPLEGCGVELTAVRARRGSRPRWWCWKCQRFWKSGIKKMKPAEEES